jgi:hypothetical protein
MSDARSEKSNKLRVDFSMSSTQVELTCFTNAGNKPLSKTIERHGDRIVKKAAAEMFAGTAQRWRGAIPQFADLIQNMPSDQAITLGRIIDGYGDEPVDVVTKAKLNGQKNTIARTGDYIVYKPGEPIFALIDYDSKDLSDSVRANLAHVGGVWAALVAVCPDLFSKARLERASTTSGLSDGNGVRFKGSDGLHLYILIADGGDYERFLKLLHKRLIINDPPLGCGAVHKGGNFVMRSIVDVSVFSAVRPVFEGKPIMGEGLVQDAEARRPRTFNIDAAPFDTKTVPDLSEDEQKLYDHYVAEERARLKPEIEASEKAYDKERVEQLTQKGVDKVEAHKIAAQERAGCLSPETGLFFGRSIGWVTVAELTADHVNKPLCDPIEPTYDGGKLCAKLLRRNKDGSLFVKSFAHGGRIFELGERPKRNRPTIAVAGGCLPYNVDQAEKALLGTGHKIYQRARALVRPVVSDVQGFGGKKVKAWGLIPVTPVYLVEQFTKAADFMRISKKGKPYSIDCTEKIAKTYLERIGAWNVPSLLSVVNVPILLPDGRLIDKPGLDEATGILFEPEGIDFGTIPSNPTRKDALAALEVLKEPIHMFPFVTEADRSVAIALHMSSVLRPALPTCPIFGLNAHAARSGKTKLAEMAGVYEYDSAI